MIQTARHGDVLVITMDRPPVNALNLQLAEAISGALIAARNDDSCRSVVLTGSAGVFSAGVDNKEVPAYDKPARSTMLRTINRTILELYSMPKPVVAAISGHALGGALVLALACDYRIAAHGPFRLGLTESEAGIPFPAGPLVVVRAELAPETARLLVLTSITAAPDAAVLRGVIDRVVEPAALVDDSVREAARLATLRSYRLVKQQLRAPAVRRLREIVENDDEPLHASWI